jgi:hypothetical protein
MQPSVMDKHSYGRFKLRKMVSHSLDIRQNCQIGDDVFSLIAGANIQNS